MVYLEKVSLLDSLLILEQCSPVRLLLDPQVLHCWTSLAFLASSIAFLAFQSMLDSFFPLLTCGNWKVKPSLSGVQGVLPPCPVVGGTNGGGLPGGSLPVGLGPFLGFLATAKPAASRLSLTVLAAALLLGFEAPAGPNEPVDFLLVVT